ncbi:MAG: ribonuclease P protein component [Endomicrobium sp.]|nr:ribonuclease P protein component [Endomicrobium sp.]
MQPKSQSFSYRERLHLQKDFNTVFKKGLKIDSKAVKILAYINKEQHIRRLGLVTPHKVGKAVIRNRTKRRLREIFRTNKHSLHPGLDLIFISKPETASLNYGSLKKIILNSLESAGLYKA